MCNPLKEPYVNVNFISINPPPPRKYFNRHCKISITRTKSYSLPRSQLFQKQLEFDPSRKKSNSPPTHTNSQSPPLLKNLKSQ